MPKKGENIDLRDRKRWCPKGHDKHKVGIASNRQCLECKKQQSNHRSPGAVFRKPICPQGHDKRIVGVANNGMCVQCRKGWYRLNPVRKEGDLVYHFCVYGHDKREVGRAANGQCKACRYMGKKGVDRGEFVSLVKIGRVRRELGISVERMAQHCHVDIATMYRIERSHVKFGELMQQRIVSGVLRAQREFLRKKRMVGDYYGKNRGAA